MDTPAFSTAHLTLSLRTRRPRTQLPTTSSSVTNSSFVTPIHPTPLPNHVTLQHARRRRNATAPKGWRMTSSQQQQRLSTSTSADERVTNALSNRSIIVTGGTGLIGRALVARLQAANARVTLLARNPARARSLFPRNTPVALPYDAAVEGPLGSAVLEALRTADVVVNLAGEPIESERWTAQRKRQLFDSRVVGTRRLVTALQQQQQLQEDEVNEGEAAAESRATENKRTTLISTSAVGYYGASQTAAFTEDSEPGSDFLATTSVAWEEAALLRSSSGGGGVSNSRTAVLRLGVVLANEGGALVKMMPAFRAFLGGPPGGGRQWFSWVHIDDVVRAILHACVDDKWQGVYNVTAPQPVRLAEFCAELGRALGRPSWLPVPKQAVMAIMGGEAAQLVLAGQQVLPKRTRATGFVFHYKDVRSALQQLIKASGGVKA